VGRPDHRDRAAGGGTLSYMSQAFDRSQFAVGIRHLF